MKNILLVLIVFNCFISNFVFAKSKRSIDVFESINTEKLNLHDVYLFRKEVLNFYNTVDKKNKYASVKSVYINNLLNKIINEAHAGNGDVCLFAGYPSQIINNICKNPATHGVIRNYGKVQSTPYESCGSQNAFRCSPLLFGTDASGRGKCIETGGTYEGLTQKCHEQTGDQIESAVTNLLNDKEAINTIVQDINGFCQKYENDTTKPSGYDHKVTCKALRDRFDKMGHEITKRQSEASEKAKEIAKTNNKALGIMKKCQEKYDEDNQGVLGSMFGSKRGILNTLTSGAVTCRDLVMNIEDNEFDKITQTFDNVENLVVQKELLERSTVIGVEASAKNLMLTMLQFDPNFNLDTLKKAIIKKAPELKNKPYSESLSKSIKDLGDAQKSNKVTKFTSESGRQAMVDKFGELSSTINNLCTDIKVLYQGVEDKGTVMNSDEENEFYSSMQAEISNKVMAFQSKASQDGDTQFSRLFATDHFRNKLFPFSGGMAEKCAEDDLSAPFAFYPPGASDIDKAVKDYKEMMLDDLDNLGEKTQALADGDQDDIEDEIQDILKYKPYLAAQFMREKQGDEQIAYAKYMCKQSLDIYNSDENFRVFEMGLGAASLAASAVALASGIGSPLAPVLASVGAGLVVAEVGVAYADKMDANNIKEGLAVGFGTNQIDARSYAKGLNAAEEQELYANAALAMAALQPIAAAAKTIAKGARAVNTARLVRKADKVDLKAVKKANKIVAKAEKKASRSVANAAKAVETAAPHAKSMARLKRMKTTKAATATKRNAQAKALKIKRKASTKSNKIRNKLVDKSLTRQTKLANQADSVLQNAAEKASKLTQKAEKKAKVLRASGDTKAALKVVQTAREKASKVSDAATKQVSAILKESDSSADSVLKALTKRTTKVNQKAQTKSARVTEKAMFKSSRVMDTARNSANDVIKTAKETAKRLPVKESKKIMAEAKKTAKKIMVKADQKASAITAKANDKALSLVTEAETRTSLINANLRKVMGVKASKPSSRAGYSPAKRVTAPKVNSSSRTIQSVKAPRKASRKVITRAEIKANGKLTNFQRKKKIKRLYPNLTDAKRLAIYQAHKKIPCPVFGCSKTELRQKMKFMKAAGIPEDIARDSIRRGITGQAYIAPSKSGIKEVIPTGIEVDDIVKVKRSSGEFSMARITGTSGNKVSVDIFENGSYIGTKNNIELNSLRVPDTLKTTYKPGEVAQVRRSAGNYSRARVTSTNIDGTYNVEIFENGQRIATKSNVHSSKLKMEGSRRGDDALRAQRQTPKASVRTENIYNENYVTPSNMSDYADQFNTQMKAVSKFEDPLQLDQAANAYRHRGYWRQHAASASRIDELPQQGWKLHISPKPENALQVAYDILPELQRRGIMHKYAGDLEKYAAMAGKSGNGQQGKFIIIYPRNAQEAQDVGRLVKGIIEKRYFDQNDFLNIANEIELAPGIFGRYGRLKSGNLKNRNGNEILGTEDYIFTPDGQIIPDPRGEVMPAFTNGFHL